MKTNTEKRAEFMEALGRLLTYASEQGIRVICFSFHRTLQQQRLLYEYGKTKTLKSKHLRWLAIDLAVIDDDGKPVWNRDERYEILGSYWESLGHKWGGRFDTFYDQFHFEYRDSDSE